MVGFVPASTTSIHVLCNVHCSVFIDESVLMLMCGVDVAELARNAQGTHAMRMTPGKREPIFFIISLHKIQPMDNILHMNTDPTKWRLPSEETK